MNRDVLVVDDDRDLAVALADLLKGEGYAVRVAHGGEAALARIEESRPALVLVDRRMPHMSGVQLASVLAHRHGEVPVEFIDKRPIDMERILGAVRYYCRRVSA